MCGCNIRTKKSKKMAKRLNSKNITSTVTKGLMIAAGAVLANRVVGALPLGNPLTSIAKIGAGIGTTLALGQPALGGGMVADGALDFARTAGIIQGLPSGRRRRRKSIPKKSVRGSGVTGTTAEAAPNYGLYAHGLLTVN